MKRSKIVNTDLERFYKECFQFICNTMPHCIFATDCDQSEGGLADFPNMVCGSISSS